MKAGGHDFCGPLYIIGNLGLIGLADYIDYLNNYFVFIYLIFYLLIFEELCSSYRPTVYFIFDILTYNYLMKMLLFFSEGWSFPKFDTRLATSATGHSAR